MSDASSRPAAPMNPQALRRDDLVRILSAAGSKFGTAAEIDADVARGAPTNADGTLNLVHYLAWLLSQDNTDANA